MLWIGNPNSKDRSPGLGFQGLDPFLVRLRHAQWLGKHLLSTCIDYILLSHHLHQFLSKLNVTFT